MASPSLIQKPAAPIDNNTGGALTWSLTTNPTNGSLIVVTGSAWGTALGAFTAAMVADNKGNTFTLSRAPGAVAMGGGNGACAIWHFIIPAGANYTGYAVTFTPSAAAAASMIPGEWSPGAGNAWATTPLDQTGGRTNAATTAATTGVTAATAAGAGLAVSAISDGQGSPGSWAIAAGSTPAAANWTNIQAQTDNSTSQVLNSDYAVTGVASAAVVEAWTLGSSGAFSAAVAVFDITAGGPIALVGSVVAQAIAEAGLANQRLSATYRHFWALFKAYKHFWADSPPVYVPAATLTDDFTGIAGAIDTTKWQVIVDIASTPSISGGQLLITSTGNAGDYGRILSQQFYSLIGSSFSVKWVQLINNAAGYQQGQRVQLDNNNELYVTYENNGLTFLKNVGGAYSTVYTFPSVPARPFWTRIRESAGTIYLDLSSDGTTWVNQYSAAATTLIQVSRVKLGLQAGQWQAAAVTTQAIFDDVNVAPAVGGDVSLSDDAAGQAVAAAALTVAIADSASGQATATSSVRLGLTSAAAAQATASGTLTVAIPASATAQAAATSTLRLALPAGAVAQASSSAALSVAVVGAASAGAIAAAAPQLALTAAATSQAALTTSGLLVRPTAAAVAQAAASATLSVAVAGSAVANAASSAALRLALAAAAITQAAAAAAPVAGLSAAATAQAVDTATPSLALTGTASAQAAPAASLALALAGEASAAAAVDAAPAIGLVGEVAAEGVSEGTFGVAGAPVALSGDSSPQAATVGALSVALQASAASSAGVGAAPSLAVVASAASQASSAGTVGVGLSGSAATAPPRASGTPSLALAAASRSQSLATAGLAVALSGASSAGATATAAPSLAFTSSSIAQASSSAALTVSEPSPAETGATGGEALVVGALTISLTGAAVALPAVEGVAAAIVPVSGSVAPAATATATPALALSGTAASQSLAAVNVSPGFTGTTAAQASAQGTLSLALVGSSTAGPVASTQIAQAVYLAPLPVASQASASAQLAVALIGSASTKATSAGALTQAGLPPVTATGDVVAPRAVLSGTAFSGAPPLEPGSGALVPTRLIQRPMRLRGWLDRPPHRRGVFGVATTSSPRWTSGEFVGLPAVFQGIAYTTPQPAAFQRTGERQRLEAAARAELDGLLDEYERGLKAAWVRLHPDQAEALGVAPPGDDSDGFEEHEEAALDTAMAALREQHGLEPLAPASSRVPKRFRGTDDEFTILEADGTPKR